MQPPGTTRAYSDTLPISGLHLLDASMFWHINGGVRRVLTAKHDYLTPMGWRHTMMAPGVQGAGSLDCRGLSIPGAGGYRMVVRRSRAQALIEQARPDVVEAADPYVLAWSVLGATERLRVPAVAFCHSNLPALAARLLGGEAALATRRGRWAARQARSYLVNLYNHFDLVLAPSRMMASRLRAWGVQHVAVQPLGVDRRVFTPLARDAAWRQRLCEHLGLRADALLYVYSGRFAPEKNLQVLADAVRLLGPGHALLAVGSGPCPPRGPGVHLLPPESQDRRLARLVASCDAYVHAGDQETFGLGALEAMACGTPLVVSAAGGLGELAEGVGLTIEGRRPHAWAEGLRAASQADAVPRVREALARAADYDWASVTDQLSRRYVRLIERRPQAYAVTALPDTVPGELPPAPLQDSPQP